ncbi:hypothetical protein D3C78_1524230 [compost metagenome]
MDTRSQLVSQLPLLVDKPNNLSLTFFKIAHVLKLLFNGAQIVLIELSGHFLPVTSDERNRIPFIQQSNRCLHLRYWNRQRGGDSFNNPFAFSCLLFSCQLGLAASLICFL